MTTRIGINGFGRIGRQVFKIIHQNYSGRLEVAAINSRRDTSFLANILKYDSIHGRYNGSVESSVDSVIVDGKSISILAGSEPNQIPWSDHGVELVIEATGRFKDTRGTSGHLERGAKKVILTAPSRSADITIAFGVNEDQYNPAAHNVISGASCTTNCAAVVAKVLHENFGIQKGFLSTIHAYTTSQALLDRWHKDVLRRGRAAATNITPTTTGAATTLAEIIPALKGKVQGIAFRVPIPDVSLIDFVVDVERGRITSEDINQALRTAAEGPLHRILEFCNEELISADFIGNPASAIIDGPSTVVIGTNMVKVLAWYDNEWGYSCRIAELTSYIADQGLQ